ncbi:MAG TPA: glycoside hydrolase family 2 TIM barrel-domain containing protein [Gemmatimonadaceae bacterium]|nr:glycoside hydrolase family 2 TIM barrel-domain containing protein [Gemmatimonadaceae bacterium]
MLKTLAPILLSSALLLPAARPLAAQAGPRAGDGARWQPAVVRTRLTVNDGWRYRAGGVEFAEKPGISDAGWERVTLPHTWNNRDVFDDVDSYRRGTAWYRKRLRLDERLRGKKLYLHFEGVNQTAEVYVNGAYAGRHEGGYTAFTVDVTDLVTFGGDAAENLIAVHVDNSHDPDIPPLSVGFALYGGIYRDVWLVATDSVHVTMTDHGSRGVYVSTPQVSRERGTVRVRGHVTNDAATARRLRVVSTVVDADGRIVARGTSEVTAAAGAEVPFDATLAAVARPHLWSPEDPYLYTVHTDVYDGERLADRVRSPLGFRWYRFDPDSGFFLNGAPYRIRGTNRHQDRDSLGSALDDPLHVRDFEIIKAMGANFVRLAHYPQDPAVLDAADRLGLLVWEEVPVVNYVTRSPAFVAHAQGMLREMIRQHYDHPSVILWGTMNEVFLWSEQGARIGRQRDTTYMRWVRDFARGMDSLARAEDPTRYTAMATHMSGDYDLSGVADVPQVLGINVYNGWYSGDYDEFGTVLDKRHAAHPEQALFVSEYGSGSDWRLNSLHPERFDHSSTYHRWYHEAYLRQARARPFVAGTAIWNEFDFSQPHIGETIPNMNQKGMATFDRQPKDVYYLYQANWTREPMVHIASRDWARRAGMPDSGASGGGVAPVVQPVDVYSNLGRVELIVNGRSLGARTPDDVRKTSWQVPFAPGDNVLEARATGDGQVRTDRLVIHMDVVPRDLRDAAVPVRALAVNVGSRAQYADADGIVWLGDQPYRPGSYGHVGGRPTMFNRNYAITGTRRTGMYFFYQDSIQGYRMDLPDGEYEVELDFMEPDPDAAPGDRVFGVTVNGQPVIERLDLVARAGFRTALPIRFTTAVTGGQGLRIDFPVVKGAAVLNAIRVVRR